METIVQNIWTKSKLLVKGLIIVFIVLILQIPTFYIRNLIEEREGRQKEAIAEVSSKWAGKQNLTGPILVLPYWQYDGGPFQPYIIIGRLQQGKGKIEYDP